MPEPSRPSPQDHQQGGSGESHSSLRSLRRPIVWVGTALTAVLTAFFVALATGFGQHIVAGNGPSPKLQIDAVRVQSPQDPAKPLKLDFTLRNVGGQLAVITAARLTVQQFAKLPHCESQGGLPSTGTYHANMPMDPAPGTHIDIPVSQQLGPDTADRFGIALRLPPDPAVTLFAYRVRIDLLYDNAA